MSQRQVLILLADRFRDEELLVPRQMLTQAGHHVELASLSSGRFTGMLGCELVIERSIDTCTADDFDALLIPGGEGTPLLRDDHRVHALVRQFVQQDRVLAMICWAPTIAAVAGVLENRCATCCHIDEVGRFSGLKSTDVLTRYGARALPGPVVTNGRLLTADGPRSAQLLAEKLLQLLDADVPAS